MTTDQVDRRTAKTRTALDAAFVELLMERGYAALNVSIIADRANVGRSTFYEHYRTKADLLRDSLRTPFAVLADLVAPTLPPARVVALLAHLRTHQQVSRVLLGWPTRPLLGQALASLIIAQLARRPGHRPLLPVEIIARQLADAQLALLDFWIAGRPACTAGDMAAALSRSSAALIAALTHTPGSGQVWDTASTA